MEYDLLRHLLQILSATTPMPLAFGPLEDSQEEHTPHPTDKDICVSCKDRRLYLWKNVPKTIVNCVKTTLAGDGPSGCWIYTAGGYQGWHTNSDVPGQRLYAAWAETAGKSGMRFCVDGKIIDSPDQAGWNVRLFTPPLWHSVYADCLRVSVGFICRSSTLPDTLTPIVVPRA